METPSVIQLYERFVEKHSFSYDSFIGDGDSSAYRELCKINVYDPATLIEKEEDIRNVIKRMGSQLQSIVHDCKGNRITSTTLMF